MKQCWNNAYVYRDVRTVKMLIYNDNCKRSWHDNFYFLFTCNISSLIYAEKRIKLAACQISRKRRGHASLPAVDQQWWDFFFYAHKPLIPVFIFRMWLIIFVFFGYFFFLWWRMCLHTTLLVSFLVLMNKNRFCRVTVSCHTTSDYYSMLLKLMYMMMKLFKYLQMLRISTKTR